jgi:Transposase IS200 like.
VEGDVRESLSKTVNHFQYEILALKLADDHVYVFIQRELKHGPTDPAQQFKSYLDNTLQQYETECVTITKPTVDDKIAI